MSPPAFPVGIASRLNRRLKLDVPQIRRPEAESARERSKERLDFYGRFTKWSDALAMRPFYRVTLLQRVISEARVRD